MTGQERAVQLRDLAFEVLRERGKPSKGVVSFTGDGFILVHRTRFDKLVVVREPSERQRYEAALRGKPPPVAFKEGLDIFWRSIVGDEPVLTMNWNDERVGLEISTGPVGG